MGSKTYLSWFDIEQVSITIHNQRIFITSLNSSVHGEYSLSPLKVQAPIDLNAKPGLMTGYDTHVYIKTFTDMFLSGRIRYGTEILSVRRGRVRAWDIRVKDLASRTEETLSYDKIVLCTGVSSKVLIALFVDHY